MRVEPWMTMYPSTEAVMLASLETLAAWALNLPLPVTDEERAVSRVLSARLNELAIAQVRKTHPELAARLEALHAGLAALLRLWDAKDAEVKRAATEANEP